MVQGVCDGFHLNFNYYSTLIVKVCFREYSLALLNTYVINHYLQSEVQMGRVAGPLSNPHLPILHVSRFEVILKCNQPGKWHLILDLSSTAGHSINDGITREDCSLHYMKVDDISAGITQLGWDKWIGKI